MNLRAFWTLALAACMTAVTAGSADATGYVTWSQPGMSIGSFRQVIQPMSLPSLTAWKSQVAFHGSGQNMGNVIMGINNSSTGMIAELRVDGAREFIAASTATCGRDSDAAVTWVFCRSPMSISAGDEFVNVFETVTAATDGTWWSASVVNQTQGVTTQLGRILAPADAALGSVMNYTYTYTVDTCQQADKYNMTIYSPPSVGGRAQAFSGTNVSQCGQMITYQPATSKFDQRIAITIGTASTKTQNYDFALDEILQPLLWKSALGAATQVAESAYSPQLRQLQLTLSQTQQSLSDTKAMLDSLTAKLSRICKNRPKPKGC